MGDGALGNISIAPFGTRRVGKNGVVYEIQIHGYIEKWVRDGER